MGRAHALILVLMVLLSSAPGVRADLPSTSRGNPAQYVSAPPTRGLNTPEDSRVATPCACALEHSLIRQQTTTGWLDEFFTGDPRTHVLDGAPGAARNTCEVPELPGSASLFLTAMLSLGAWQLARSVRQFDFGAFPDWYHCDGPLQVGHAVAFDLNFHALPLCFIAVSAEQSGASVLCYRVGREERTPCTQRSHLRASTPRAPPVCS